MSRLEIKGTTNVVGIIGWPVEHSLSPMMHNAAFAELGLDFCYVALPVRPDMLREAIVGIKALGFKGLNVTVPHKEAVMPLLDKVDPEAAFIGAANTVVLHNTKLVGYNTDGRGFLRSLTEEGVEVKGKKILIIGSGGAARAVSWYLAEAGAMLDIHARNPETSQRLVDDLLINFKDIAIAESVETSVAEADIVINTTPLGLKDGDELPLDTSMLKGSQVAVDLIYKETPFLQEAQSVGAKTINGTGMLLWQGVYAFELWTGQEAPVSLMKHILMSSFK